MKFLTNILTVAKQIAAWRATSQAAAQLAGARSTSTPPLNRTERENRYWAQNRTRRVTARQRRRLDHKANLAARHALTNPTKTPASRPEPAPVIPTSAGAGRHVHPHSPSGGSAPVAGPVIHSTTPAVDNERAEVRGSAP